MDGATFGTPGQLDLDAIDEAMQDAIDEMERLDALQDELDDLNC